MDEFGNSNQSGFEINDEFEEAVSEEKTVEKSRPFAHELIEGLEMLAFSVVIVVLIFSFLFRTATIDGNSMLNTLHNGEWIIITKLGYKPKYKDIVVISRNAHNVSAEERSEKPIIKRVIATGGQTINIDFDTATVYVDGVPLDEPYISNPTDDKYDVDFPLYVPEGYVFVMGDNRGDSKDSRFKEIGENGLINEKYILGHAVFRLFPFDTVGSLTNE